MYVVSDYYLLKYGAEATNDDEMGLNLEFERASRNRDLHDNGRKRSVFS